MKRFSFEVYFDAETEEEAKDHYNTIVWIVDNGVEHCDPAPKNVSESPMKYEGEVH